MDQTVDMAVEGNLGIKPTYDGHLDLIMMHALLDSLFNIFSTLVKLPINIGIPTPKQDSAAKGEISALMGMNADNVSGSVALSFNLPSVRMISLHLLGKEITCLDSEALDLIGELTNMLVGGAKSILAEEGYDFDMQTPQLLQGEDHAIEHIVSKQAVLVPITIEQVEFYMELSFV